MINAHCATTTRMQKVKGQGHTRPKLDLEAWRRHILGPVGRVACLVTV